MDLPEQFWPIIASVARTGWPPRTSEEAHRFVGQCAMEGALPLLYCAAPPDELLKSELVNWRALQLLSQRRTSILTRTIATLPLLLGEEFILLKGSDVAHRLYPDPTLRPMGDIDVLVPLERIDAISDRLTANGIRLRYRRLMHFSPRNVDRAFDLGDATLDVHHSILHRASARIDYAALWSTRVPLSVAGIDFSRLSDPDSLLTLTLNIAKDNLAAPLTRYLDLWLMQRANRQATAVAAERAHQWRVENAFYAVLRVASVLFPDIEVPLQARRLFDRLVLPRGRDHVRDIRRVSRLTRLWRKYWLLDGLDLRLQYFVQISAAAAYGLWRRKELERD